MDPALALLSYGSLTSPHSMAMELIADEIVVTWCLEGHYQGVDLAMLMAYAPETGQTSYDTAAAKRHEGRVTLKLPSNVGEHRVHFYIAFVAFDHSARSNSYYLDALAQE